MGLTRTSVRSETGTAPDKGTDEEISVALMGNPNVGKSTVFNALTGMHQHTGNWSGKTVGSAAGRFVHGGRTYCITDLPGTYSLLTRSAEEAVARDHLLQKDPQLTVAVCDASCLERNLNLVLQILEVTPRVLVCVNLMDEAEKRLIRVDTAELEKRLGVPVIGISARRKKDIAKLREAIAQAADTPPAACRTLRYPEDIEETIRIITESGLTRRQALRLLDGSDNAAGDTTPPAAAEAARTFINEHGSEEVSDRIVTAAVRTAEEISRTAVSSAGSRDRDRRIDRILTGRLTSYPVMLLLLLLLFWITITGANYPSSLLSGLFTSLETPLFRALSAIGTPVFLCEMLVFGMYRVLAWVTSVMLPPMAIFFPLFTLLEDVGYLPRIAYNLDRCFQRCSTCGKQALTMCMGFGCNAAGVVGCRIIDSPRERLIAVLTNSLVPCNGRFPLLIAITSLFFVTSGGMMGSLAGAAMLAGIIVISIGITLAVSALLSKTLLRGVPSAFTLELPPYRRPVILSVLVRSVLDRTLFVLGRAAAVAAPAGMLIWILANVTVGENTLFWHLTAFLDPAGRVLGMDGVILLSFILGFPANETVIPIMMMGYLSAGTLTEYGSLTALGDILRANGWTPVTALCVILFSLMHWPCSTTVWTIARETRSFKWTAVGILLPTAAGCAVCMTVHAVSLLFR